MVTALFVPIFSPYLSSCFHDCLDTATGVPQVDGPPQPCCPRQHHRVPQLPRRGRLQPPALVALHCLLISSFLRHTYRSAFCLCFQLGCCDGGCNQGPCRTKPPYFGYVKRAMNRAPGPRDYWWARHAQSCGGTFEKVLSPPAPPARPRSKRPRTHGTEPPAASDEKTR